LVLEPMLDLIKKKPINLVDFSKQLGRPETKHYDDDDVYIDGEKDKPPIPNDPSVPTPLV